MLSKLICFFIGHKITRSDVFDGSPIVQYINPELNLTFTCEYCGRCGAIHGIMTKNEKEK